MTDDVLQQIIGILNSAKNIALVLPAEPTLDSVVAANAMHALVLKLGGTATLSSASNNHPALPFLKQNVPIETTFGSAKEFAVKISTANAKPGELRYEMESGSVVIYLKAKEGVFTPADVSTVPTVQKYDALILLGVNNLDQLGKLYTDNTSVFFETPVINIDNDPANEYYGTINLINVKASSVSEVVLDIASLVPGAMEEDGVTTALLAGIIDQTQSFRDPKTTPATLSKASLLVQAGARQQDIIQHIFKTKPFSTLQLWGRAMARLVTVPEASLLYSAVTKSDMEKTMTDESVLTEVLRDLVDMVSDFSIVALAAELPHGTKLLIAGLPHIKVEEVLQKMGVSSEPPHRLSGKFEYVTTMLPGINLADVQNTLTAALSTR